MAAPQAIELLDALTSAVRRAAHSSAAENVHKIRVAIRRLNQSLAMLNAPAQQIEKMKRVLKVIMGFAGKTRDYDISIKLAEKAKASRRLLVRLRKRRAAAAKLLVLDLQKWLELGTAGRWKDVIARSHPGSGADRVVSKAVKRLFKRGAAAEESQKKLHPLRVAAKKLRYTLDLVDTPDPAHLEQVKELQKRLGDINDYETARRIAAEESAGKRVLARLAEKQDKKIHSFRRYWDREFSGETHRQEWQQVTLPAPLRARSITVAPPRRGAAVMKRVPAGNRL